MYYLHCQNGFRPSRRVSRTCQGSMATHWQLIINTNGNVTFSRYGTNKYEDVPTSAWLIFDEIFSI